MASLRAVLGFCTAFATVACFDSDETFKSAGTTTTGTATTSTTDVDPTMSFTTTATTEIPDATCRDAIACIQACVVDLITNPDPEPDLGCFLECIEEMLTEDEARKLLELSNCVSNLCEAEMKCDSGETSTGGSSSSGGESSSTTEPPEPPPLIDPCLDCIFNKLPLQPDDPELGECGEFAMECT